MGRTQHWLPLASRIAAALLGGYFVAWAFTTLVIASHLAAGADYDEGLLLAYLLAFLVYLVAFLWSFATVKLTRVWLTLAGGGAAMAGLAWVLTPSVAVGH